MEKGREIASNVDWDYPSCGGLTVYATAHKNIYIIEHSSNYQGQWSGEQYEVEFGEDLQKECGYNEYVGHMTALQCMLAYDLWSWLPNKPITLNNEAHIIH